MKQIETIIDNGELSAKELHKYLVNTPDAFFTNIKEVEENLKSLANKYSSLEVDKSNYKKEAHKAESELRNTRYSIQNLKKSTLSKIKDLRDNVDDKFEELIAIISPLENSIKTKVKAIEAEIIAEKEEVKRLAAERENKILDRLKFWESKLEDSLNDSENSIEKYEAILAELESEFDTFDEHTFQAKRIHAIFKGRKNEILSRIEAKKAVEELEKHLLEMLAMRKQNLQDLGGELIQGGIKFNLSIGTVLDAKLKSMNQEEFQDFLRKIRAEISTKEILAQRQEQEERLKIENEFKALYETFTALGGDTSTIKLEVNVDNIKHLKSEVEKLHLNVKKARNEAVKNELIDFHSFVDEFTYKFETVLNGTSFEYQESRQNCVKFLEELKRIHKIYL